MKKSLAVLAAFVLAAASCSNPAASAPAAARSYVQGVITAKGSVWVNGIEYQTTGSAVSVEGQSRADDDLKVGMTVELRAVFDPASGQWKAERVDYESDLRGQVESVDTGTSSFVLAGKTVLTDAATVFEGAAGVADLKVDDFVEVSGTENADGAVAATRVEVKDGPTSFKVTAVVTSAITSDAQGGSFEVTYKKLAAFTVVYTGTLDPAIGEGSRVRILFAAADLNLNDRTVTTTADQIQLRTTEPRARQGDHSEVRGVVAGLAGTDPVTFTLGTQPVSVSAAVLAGRALAEGDRVEVEGTIGSDGVLTASRLHQEPVETELPETQGTVAAVDLTARTLTVHPASGEDVTFTVTDRTIFRGDLWFGADPLAKLAVGAAVEVKSFTDTSVPPSQEVAVKIESDAEDEAHHRAPGGGGPS